MSVVQNHKRNDSYCVAQNGNAVRRIGLTAKTVWRRIFRHKRVSTTPILPRYFALFVIFSVLVIGVAGYFDGQISIYMSSSRNSFFWLLRIVTDAAKSHFYLIPALLIMTVITTLDWRQRKLGARKVLVRAYERAAFVFFSIIIPGILVNIAKQFVGRGRPRTLDEYGVYAFKPFEFVHTFQSFPSGHSATAGSIGMIIALYMPALRWPALFVLGILAFARITANAHYLSDVIAGYLLGSVLTLLFARWLASRAIMFQFEQSSMFPKLKN